MSTTQDVANAEPQAVHLTDYRPPTFTATHVSMLFDLHEGHAHVVTTTRYERHPAGDGGDELVLLGEDFELVAVKLDDRTLAASEFKTNDSSLTLAPGSDAFTLEITTRLEPQNNKALAGLYRSGSTFCTQMEAEGFRRVTYFLDRPDVLAVYDVRIEADKTSYPVLLSNGNPGATGDLKNGRHFAEWQDPHPKPCYLFALVGGRLGLVEDTFKTMSGRTVPLKIWCDPGNESRCAHAMDSLKRSMAWDEQVFGLEYDLDIFQIVAVHDFNMGAMENKGLNIFNASVVLANTETATDGDFQRIEGVVAHEYFHNWTGNRVTCRDWFQLSLKEGLTVFRDQEFSSDTNSRPVQRISDVRRLRDAQFPEDAGPLAHPIRPESFIKIDNFYTSTVYEKGAEVIRMMHTLLGSEGFRRGMDLYFERHDGQAVTCDDFVAAMEDSNSTDLTTFRRWYRQAGTPTVTTRGTWEAGAGTYTLSVEQNVPATPGQPDKEPAHIPLSIALLARDGSELPMHVEGVFDGQTSGVLNITEAAQSFTFTELASEPVPSLFRGFSAPVRVVDDIDDEARLFLATHDTDAFNRWEAAQTLAATCLLRAVNERAATGAFTVPQALVDMAAALLADESLDPALLAEALVLPGESDLGDRMTVVDVEGIHEVRRAAKHAIAGACEAALVARYEKHKAATNGEIDATAFGHRALQNVCLSYLASLGGEAHVERVYAQFTEARTMTEQFAALAILTNLETPRRIEALAAFRDRFGHDALVLNKWFSVQASASRDGAFEEVVALTEDASFDISNPNRARSVYGALARTPTLFHRADGKGYRLIADAVLAIDKLNPVFAGRVAGVFSQWRRYDDARQALIRTELERILAVDDLSANSFEIIDKTLRG